jgi:hypothetical protein
MTLVDSFPELSGGLDTPIEELARGVARELVHLTGKPRELIVFGERIVCNTEAQAVDMFVRMRFALLRALVNVARAEQARQKSMGLANGTD